LKLTDHPEDYPELTMAELHRIQICAALRRFRENHGKPNAVALLADVFELDRNFHAYEEKTKQELAPAH
jgi:hypothetical protein